LYPNIFTAEDIHLLESTVTKEEIIEALNGMTKEKSPGPDGWIVEFYISFFELVANDLLLAIEESCFKGAVIRSLNSNFIALIPKVNGPSTFGDFQPISLCNLNYKIITKILASRLRLILSRSLAEEQFGFLKGRQITDVMGTTQECLHSIREKRL
jgi:hypothetical protein